ncbi:MAG: hypothetical protein GY861_04130, partial [bacterium]|nr:hypothetical protein [bacterium]
MADFRLEIAPRQIDRLFEKAIGNSIVKALTEPITNSDDSYRRLEQGLSTSSSVKKRSPITIKVFRNTRIFQIIDQAEGLTNKEMEEKFVAYGADMSGQSVGLPVRGLFGKGLKDVMFTQQKSNVKTIKDGKSYKCKFHRKGDDHVVSIIPGPKVTSDLRRSWGIGNGNGTVVEFQLRDGVPLPLHDKLVEKLCKFYMLHTIASANKRVLEVQTYSNNGQLQKKSIVKYEEPTGIVLLDHSFNLTFENYSDIKVEVTIKRHENELEQTNFEEREGGLLVIDDRNTVYDLALFGFDRDPYATRLFGTVRLTGARQIILDKLRQNEEILSDTRDGFDRKHSFYSTLAKKIDALLEPLVKKEREIKQANQKSDVSADQKKRHIEACEKLNQLYESLTGGKSEFIGTDPESNTDPPKDGIEFVRPKITITANKYYAIVLRIDTNRIRPGSTIVINSTNNYITASPAMLVVDDPKTDDSVINKTITIQSTGS